MDLPAKPLLRGVFHQYAFVAAVAAGATLASLAENGRERFAVGVYAASLAVMFGASALYHRGPWRSSAVRAWMRRLDHSGIFLLIAGTYTPFALLALHGTFATVLLVLVWAGAAAGLVLNLVWIDAPKWSSAAGSTRSARSPTRCAGRTRGRPCSASTSSSTCSSSQRPRSTSSASPAWCSDLASVTA
jgi:hypothetical protein